MRAAGQLDLLDWQAPEPVAAFGVDQVRAVTFGGRLSRAIGVSLAECGDSRGAVAGRMGEWLGRTVSVNMLNAYASQAREEHVPPTDRFAALCHATQDRRLLQLLAAPHGWAVIERRYLPLIELAAVREREDALRRQAAALRRRAQSGGLL